MHCTGSQFVNICLFDDNMLYLYKPIMNILIDVDGIGVVIEQKSKVSEVKAEDHYRYFGVEKSDIIF